MHAAASLQGPAPPPPPPPPPVVPPAAAEAPQLQAQQLASEDELPLLLSGVRIVLVAPKTPANIGAVLRVAANFEVRAWMMRWLGAPMQML